MRKILDLISETLMSAIVTGMILAVCWQVFSRYVLNDPSGFTEEFLRYSLIWLTMISGAYAYGRGKHMAVVFLVRNFPELLRMKIRVVIDCIVIAFASVVFIYGGIITSSNAVGQVSAALRMPIQFLYISLCVSGTLIVLYAILNIKQRIEEIKSMS